MGGSRDLLGGQRRNGGFALRETATPFDVAVELLGRERAAELWLFTERYLDQLAQLAGDSLRRLAA